MLRALSRPERPCLHRWKSGNSRQPVMTPDEAFRQAICEAPEDDTPRLIYADWLEERGRGDRAEFIRAQCALTRGNADAKGQETLRARAAGLLEAHWEEWVGPLEQALRGDPVALSWMHYLAGPYRPEALNLLPRGFVESVALTARRFTARAEALAQNALLIDLRLHGAGSHAEALAATPQLASVSQLMFLDYYQDPMTAGAMASLAASPFMRSLKVLWLHRNNLGDAGVGAIRQARWAGGLQSLELSENGLSAEAVTFLVEAKLDDLRVLNLSNNAICDEGLTALCDSILMDKLQTLNVARCGIGDVGVAALGQCCRAGALRVLNLEGNLITERGLTALAGSPNLGQLKFVELRGNACKAPQPQQWASLRRRLGPNS